MPFIPHTEEDIRAMLKAIGVGSIEQLFDEIPASLRNDRLENVPSAMNEMDITRLMSERAAHDGTYLNFIGAGAYEHHIPAAVWQIATRGEFYSAYTPYQAEASQGTLQVLYEYQSMMASLTAMDVTNASLYDGASALAEAVLMAVRTHKGAKRVLLPLSVHPVWRRVVKTIVRNQGIELVDVPYCAEAGHILPDALAQFKGQEIAALVVPQPNFFGVLEPADELTDWAHANNALLIAAVNPLALAILKPPGAWGAMGADIAVGDGQPLGIPLASGGPYFGFLACRKSLLRQLPGRLVGATVDTEGKPGYVLTLQAREQHIRRSRATSNICTNQGLMVTAATIYMALLGPDGLARAARASHTNALALLKDLTAIEGVERAFNGPVFHEFVLRLKTPLALLLKALKAQGILGGLNLAQDHPELGQSLLVCATETKTAEDLRRYTENMARIVGKHFRTAPCALKPSPNKF
ncbi:MAG: aminomethyl-transferring glycine dehydrogenase subunit GcvPA [Burkholderiales bacterium]|nr:aminomethyl-transferring glycine dehydrogenase subunit GcvPA [Burkholderiales bacterium]